MIIDLTNKITKELLEWIDDLPDNKHVETGHIGTHLDIYNKSEVPMEYFKTKGILIDISHISEEREIEIEDIKDIFIPENSFVLFRTGRIEKYPYGDDEYFKDHPQLSHDLIQYLIDKKIYFIGMDCSGVRRGEEHQDADELCEKNGCYIIENICNLDKLVDKNIESIYTIWLDHPTATGIPVRVLAEIQ